MIVDKKVSPRSGVAKKLLHGLITTAVGQTKTILDICQIPYSFVVERVGVYASAVTDTCTFDTRIVPVGGQLKDVTLTVGGTSTKFKLNSALVMVNPVTVSPATLPAIVYKAITDNLQFSSAFTINAAGAAAALWGAVRVQIDGAGNITTKVCAQDQAFATEAYAKTQLPPPDPGCNDLGSITIQMVSGDTFTAKTTALDDASVSAVHYNGRASDAVSVMTGEVGFVAGKKIFGTMVSKLTSRAIANPGGLLVIDYTTAAVDGALVNGRYDVEYRPFPMETEAVVPA